MKTNVIFPQLLHLEFETQKEQTLTMFRVQEYYESNKPNLKGKVFDAFTFLHEMMDDEGNIDYFSYWDGFNIPGHVFEDWKAEVSYIFTDYEKKLYAEVMKSVDTNKPYYIITCCIDDSDTLEHEIAHALYYLNTEYTKEVTNLIADTLEDLKIKVFERFDEMGYAQNVYNDELNAWLATSKKKDLRDNLGILMSEYKSEIKRYRKLYQKYNTIFQ